VSPVPSRDRLPEIAVKAVHLGLRQIGQSPEHRIARRLAEQTALLPPPAESATRVLFLTPRDWAIHVQWESIVGHALRRRGAHVEYLTCGGDLEICDRANTWEAPPMPCATCDRYVSVSLDAHGFPNHPLARWWKPIDEPWPEIDEVSRTDLVNMEDGGLPLGRLADIPLKWFLMTSRLEDDPLAGVTARRFLRSARRVARALDRALDERRPDVVVLCNGFFLFEAICWELCRRKGIDVVTYERAFIKETMIWRRGGPACFFDLGDEWARWRDVELTESEAQQLDGYLQDRQVGRQTIDRYWVNPEFRSPERQRPGRLVALFANLTWDSAVIGQEVAFPSIQEWATATIAWFAEHPEHELLVRLHPAETRLPGKQTREPLEPFLRSAFPELPENVRIIAPDDPMSSYPIMAACDLGLVFTSTTGLELALAGKPVVVAGQTHYRDKGFTVDVSDREEYVAQLGALVDDPSSRAPDVDLVRRYAHMFFFKAPVASPGVEEHVLGLARITVDDIDDLRPGVDPDLDRICGVILDEPGPTG